MAFDVSGNILYFEILFDNNIASFLLISVSMVSFSPISLLLTYVYPLFRMNSYFSSTAGIQQITTKTEKKYVI